MAPPRCDSGAISAKACFILLAMLVAIAMSFQLGSFFSVCGSGGQALKFTRGTVAAAAEAVAGGAWRSSSVAAMGARATADSAAEVPPALCTVATVRVAPALALPGVCGRGGAAAFLAASRAKGARAHDDMQRYLVARALAASLRGGRAPPAAASDDAATAAASAAAASAAAVVFLDDGAYEEALYCIIALRDLTMIAAQAQAGAMSSLHDSR